MVSRRDRALALLVVDLLDLLLLVQKGAFRMQLFMEPISIAYI